MATLDNTDRSTIEASKSVLRVPHCSRLNCELRTIFYRSDKTTGLLRHHMIRVLRVSAQFTLQSGQSMHRMFTYPDTVLPTMNRLFLLLGL